MNDDSRILAAIGIFIILYSVVLINLGIVELPELDLINLFVDIMVLAGALVITIALMMEEHDKIKTLECRIEYLEDNCEKSENDN